MAARLQAISLTDSLPQQSNNTPNPGISDHKENSKEKEDNETSTYACQLCSATYKKLGSLTNHKKNKHDIKDDCPLKCEVCEKYFENTKKLNRHKKIHK